MRKNITVVLLTLLISKLTLEASALSMFYEMDNKEELSTFSKLNIVLTREYIAEALSGRCSGTKNIAYFGCGDVRQLLGYFKFYNNVSVYRN